MDEDHDGIVPAEILPGHGRSQDGRRRWLLFTLLTLLVALLATSSALAGSTNPAEISAYLVNAAKSATGAKPEHGCHRKAVTKDNAIPACCKSKTGEAKSAGGCCSNLSKASALAHMSTAHKQESKVGVPVPTVPTPQTPVANAQEAK